VTDEHDMNEAMKTWPEEPTQEVPEKPESPIPGASVEYVFLRTGKGENDEEEHWKGLGMPPELALAFGGAMAEAASEMLFPEMVFAMDNPKGRQDN